mmetsp:Transcript_479/g.862  ORF Transcript_479/g.862 Transcript_479/m.862 type:complete len:196 (-) Transcript_479:323-910(-)|eukprot:CAMPEP_0182447616 /NCGR_PEP_ID=MMETSP1172-20130603/17984_1 /TAXON_ID=708627 /ORGANISM="Timspurckia oligopyrenoides, Strain CCMP3278" /LENGTH=195 /DNA_ID=CAMNT_0024644119 /DNA_START=30 /DNA_END=617 /DNA_ORIENTATION=+
MGDDGVADDLDEMLEVVSEHDDTVVLSLHDRKNIHMHGYWHRAVYVLIFSDSDHKLLLQQRSPNKSIGASTWDLSCAEHVSPKESYLNAGIRGVHEELGLTIDPKSMRLLLPKFTQSRTYPNSKPNAQPIIDNEHITVYYTQMHHKQFTNIKLQRSEVSNIRFISVENLYNELDSLSPWFQELIRQFDLRSVSLR